MSESTIQHHILKALKGLPSCVAWKVQHANERGVPDIIGCYNGRFFGMEVKTAHGRATPLQLLQLQRIEEAGGIAGIVHSAAEALALLEEKSK